MFPRRHLNGEGSREGGREGGREQGGKQGGRERRGEEWQQTVF
jgi:hypothetical protein